MLLLVDFDIIIFNLFFINLEILLVFNVFYNYLNCIENILYVF